MEVLIVDDSKAMRMMVRRALRKAGFGACAVREAENGMSALDALAGSSPDVVLCDWNMPEMTGIQLLEKLNEQGKAVPFVFVTSEGTPEMRARAEAAGARHLIAKPFTAEAFQEALSPILE